ncbi:MAG: MFS transporter [Nitrospinae bacterium]|nr:MFS transporter [Nitrospinota bacterium]
MADPGEKDRARPRFFYGWVILGTSFSIMVLSSGLNMSFGVFLRTLIHDYGWTTSMLSLTYSIFMIAAGIASFTAGRLADRFSPRLVFLGGGLIYGLGILLTSQTTMIWHLYLFYGVMAGIGNSPMNIIATMAVSRWFSKAQGLAMGILNSGTGAGPAIFGPLAAYLIITYGWQDSYIILGLTAWGIALSAFVFLRNDPGDMGMQPYGEGAGPHAKSAWAAGVVGAGGKIWQFRDIARTRTFWELAILHFACCVCHAIPLLHIVPYAEQMGLSKLSAAWVLGITGVTSFAGRIFWGVLADRQGVKPAFVMSTFAQALMMIWVIGARHPLMFYIWATVWGFGYGGVMPPYALFVKQYYGMAAFGATYGAIMVAASVGMAGGGLIAGLLYDFSGSYTSSWILSVAAGLVTAFVAMDLRTPARASAPAGHPLNHDLSSQSQAPADVLATVRDRDVASAR